MVSFALPAWRRAKQESDRDPEYGAQAYQQEMAMTSIERQGSALRGVLSPNRRREDSKKNGWRSFWLRTDPPLERIAAKIKESGQSAAPLDAR
jgi:hypothetical protein